jgi:hypothetical protein
MTATRRPNRFAQLGLLAVLLLVLAPAASHFAVPALVTMAVVIIVLRVGMTVRRGPV